MRFQILFGWFVLVCVWFYSKGQCPAYSNFVVQQGYRLYGHVIIWLYAENEVLCRLKCNIVEGCLSFNYKEATRVCELNDADDEKDLQEASGFVYVDIKKSTSTSTTPPTSASTTPTTSASTTQTTKTETSASTIQTASNDASTSTTSSTKTTTQSAVTDTGVSTTPPTSKPGQCKPEVAIGIKSKNTIPDAYITASENNHIAKKARLNGPGGWWMRCNRNLPCNEQWIQVNVGKIAKITGIETQGASYQSQMYYTEKYRLSYSNGSTFNDYNNRQVLHGNNDSNTIVHNELTPAITAIYVRLHPMKDKSGYIALRMELYECKDDEAICSYALGMESKMISNAQIAASSTFHSSYPSNARLNYNGAWMTSKDERKNEWLQINFNQIKNINGIATQGRKYEQGRKHEQAWVKEYRLNYTNATYEAPLVYTKDGKPFEFKGNSDHNSIVYNAILPPIIAQIVLIVPTEWETFIALRIELYGCPYKGAYDDRNSM